MSTVRITSGKVVDMLKCASTNLYPTTGIAAISVACTTSTITETTFTAVAAATNNITVGNTLTGTGVSPNTVILEQLTGTAGGIGTYRVSVSQTVTSTTITASSTGPWLLKDSPFATFQACVDGTSGAQTATVTIEGSNDGIHPCGTVLGTITLSGTVTASDGFTTTAPWKYVRASVTAISGTGALVTAMMGV